MSLLALLCGGRSFPGQPGYRYETILLMSLMLPMTSNQSKIDVPIWLYGRG
jgi:hypothetical protein